MASDRKFADLKINYSCEELRNAVDSVMRQSKLPGGEPGFDIIRGVIYGMIDHPEYTLDDALLKAQEYSKMPGKGKYDTLEQLIECAYECVETRLPLELEYDGERVRTHYEIVKVSVENYLFMLRSDYANKLVRDALKVEGYEISNVPTRVLDYAVKSRLMFPSFNAEDFFKDVYRMAFSDGALQENIWKIMRAVADLVDPILPTGRTVFTYADEIAQKIYSDNE